MEMTLPCLSIFRLYTLPKETAFSYKTVVLTADSVSTAASTAPDPNDADRGAGETNGNSKIIEDDS